MSRTKAISKRTMAKRMDTLLALPLARFRRALTELTSDELAALAARIALLRVKNRWARGGFGLARHRSPLELGLLARRETALRREQEARLTAPAPIRLLPHQADRPEGIPEALADRAA